MSLVHHQPCTIFLFEYDDFLQWCGIPIHRKNTFSDDQAGRPGHGGQFFYRLDSRFLESGMVCEPEIIVRRKSQEGLAANGDTRALGRIHPTQIAKEVLLAKSRQAAV